MSDTCSLFFFSFGDPCTSCLLSQTRLANKRLKVWGQGPRKSSRYSRGGCLRVKEFRAGISRVTLLDVEGLRE